MSSGGVGGCGVDGKLGGARAHPFPTNRNRRAYRCRMAFRTSGPTCGAVARPPGPRESTPREHAGTILLNLIIGSLYPNTRARAFVTHTRRLHAAPRDHGTVRPNASSSCHISARAVATANHAPSEVLRGRRLRSSPESTSELCVRWCREKRNRAGPALSRDGVQARAPAVIAAPRRRRHANYRRSRFSDRRTVLNFSFPSTRGTRAIRCFDRFFFFFVAYAGYRIRFYPRRQGEVDATCGSRTGNNLSDRV